jgi:outer membrane lipoprotein-sorting protein
MLSRAVLTLARGADSIEALNRGLSKVLSQPWVLGLALPAVLLSGACVTVPHAASRPKAPPLRRASLEEVVAAYEGYCRAIDTFSASGDLDVRDLRLGRSQRLGVRVVAARGGRLYLKGSVAVVTAVEVVANGQRFWLQVPSKHTVWTGATSARARPAGDDEKDAYSALRPEDLTAAMLPDQLAPEEGEALVLEADRETFSVTVARLRVGRGWARQRVWMSRETLLPLRSRTFDDAGEVVREVRFGAWKDGLPRSLAVLRPTEGYEAAFTFTKVERNVAVPERAFAPRTPEGYTVVEVDGA